MEIHLYKLRVILDVTSKYKPKVYNSCHDFIMKAMNFNKVAIVSVNGITG